MNSTVSVFGHNGKQYVVGIFGRQRVRGLG